MLLDTIGERYGMLPSEVMSRATTFDIFVCDTAIGYRNLVQQREYDKANGGVTSIKTEDFSQQDLMAMIARTKKE